MHFQIEVQQLELATDQGQIERVWGTAALFDQALVHRLRQALRAWAQKPWAGTTAPGWRNTLKRTGVAFFIEGSTLEILPAQPPTSLSPGEALLFHLQTPIKSLNLLIYGNERGQIVVFPKLEQDQEGLFKEALHRGAQILLNRLQTRLASYGLETQIKFESDRYTLIPRVMRLNGQHWTQLTGQSLPPEHAQIQFSFTPATLRCWIQDQKLRFEVKNMALHCQGNALPLPQIDLNHASVRGDFDPNGRLEQLEIQHITGHFKGHFSLSKWRQESSTTGLDHPPPVNPWFESPAKLKPVFEALGLTQDPLETVADLLSPQPYHAWITDLKQLKLYAQQNPSIPLSLSFQGGSSEKQRAQPHTAQGILLQNLHVETRIECKPTQQHHQYLQVQVQCDALNIQRKGFSLTGLQSHLSLDSQYRENPHPPQILSLRLRGHFHHLHGDHSGLLTAPTPETNATESATVSMALQGEIHAPDLTSPTLLKAQLTCAGGHWNAAGLSAENVQLQADFKEAHRQTQLAGSGKHLHIGIPTAQRLPHFGLQAAQLQQFEMHAGPLRLNLSGQDITCAYGPHSSQFNAQLHWHLHHHSGQIRTRIQGLSYLQQIQAPPAPLHKNVHEDLYGKIKLTPTAFVNVLKLLNLSTAAHFLHAHQILKNETLQLKIDAPTAYAEGYGEPLTYALVARLPDLETRYGPAQLHIHHHPAATQIECKLTPNTALVQILRGHIEKESQGVVESIAFENGRLYLSLDLPQILAWVRVSIRCEGQNLRMSIHDARFLGLLQVTLTARESVISALQKYGAYAEGQDILIPVEQLLPSLVQGDSESLKDISAVSLELTADHHRQHHITLSVRHQA